MPFSTSFCITNTGNLLPGTSVNFFSDIDDYTAPFRTNILLSDITSPNCPYVLSNIPDGTTIIQLSDVNSSCCVTIPISTFTCDNCNFGFDVYSSVTFNSSIVAGNLTASCDNNITDYVIEWYNVNDLTTPLYVSGKGTAFQQYQTWTFPHPLVGSGSIPTSSGTYRPVIKYIRLNGVNYSSNLETGLVQIPLQDCLTNTTINVNPLTCDNGTNIGDYTHLVEFSSISQGQPPSLLTSTFILSPNTNYFAWRFQAFNVPDTLRITYFGNNYSDGLVLEYFNVGSDNTNSNTFVEPKVVRTSLGPFGYFNKVTCLTGITRSVNDYLVIDIIPNPINPKTDFQLYFTCLENYDCSTCYDNYLNGGYKIIGDSISTTNYSCQRIEIGFNISGCTYDDLINSDYFKYTYTPGVFSSAWIENSLPLISYPPPPNKFASNFLYFEQEYCFPIYNVSRQTRCQQTLPNNNLITFTKDNSGVGGIGNVYMEFSNPNDLNDFFTTYNERLNELGGVQTDPTTLEFYSYITLRVPTFPNMIPVEIFNDPCGDGTLFRGDYRFHTSSVVTTGVTGNNYFMNLTMPTITDEIDFTVCELGCEVWTDQIINEINQSSSGTTNNQSWVNGRGNRIDVPFYGTVGIIFLNNPNTSSYIPFYMGNSDLLNTTIPMSGSNYTSIPSLSSSTCNLVGELGQGSGGLIYNRFLFEFRTELTNPSDINDYRILAKNIINGQRVGNFFTVYEVQNGVVIYSDPNFII